MHWGSGGATEVVDDETDDVDTSEDEVGASVVSVVVRDKVDDVVSLAVDEVVAMVRRVEVSEVGSETEGLVPADETE